MLSKSTQDQMGSSSKQTFTTPVSICDFSSTPHLFINRMFKKSCKTNCGMLFVLLFLGRWRREPCWLTPPPLTLLSQKKWQSLQKRWVLCLWMLQCQEVMVHLEKQSLHFVVLWCVTIDTCTVALLCCLTFKTTFHSENQTNLQAHIWIALKHEL